MADATDDRFEGPVGNPETNAAYSENFRETHKAKLSALSPRVQELETVFLATKANIDTTMQWLESPPQNGQHIMAARTLKPFQTHVDRWCDRIQNVRDSMIPRQLAALDPETGDGEIDFEYWTKATYDLCRELGAHVGMAMKEPLDNFRASEVSRLWVKTYGQLLDA